MKKQSLYVELNDFLKAIIMLLFTVLKAIIIFLFIWLRHLFLIRLGLLSVFMRFSKTDRAMGKCQKDICKTLKILGKLDNPIIAYFREAFEKTKTGKAAVRTNPNRRLYAVLIPTKEENLQRLKNVFDFMSYEEKSLRLRRLNYLLPRFQNVNRIAKKTRKLYKAGKISKVAAIETIRQSVRF